MENINETQFLYLSNKKIFYGKNMTFFNGKIICGIKEHFPMFMFIIIITIVLFTVWGYYVFTFYIFNNILYFPIIQYISFICGLYNCFKCFMTEPGVIPRNCNLLKIEKNERLENPIKNNKNIDNNTISLETISFINEDKYIINNIIIT
jgi:hypothetical protein